MKHNKLIMLIGIVITFTAMVDHVFYKIELLSGYKSGFRILCTALLYVVGIILISESLIYKKKRNI